MLFLSFSSYAMEKQLNLSEVIKHEQKEPSDSPKGLFSRGPGYWTDPSDETKDGFFEKLTDPKSQREDWYTQTEYIAEPLCAISNIGFLIFGVQNNSPELVFAGLASTVSHAIPKQWLLTVDKLGVAVVMSKVVREHQIFINNPWLAVPLGCAGLINLADTYLARNYGKTWPHVVWHLSSAALVHYVFQHMGK